MRIMLFIGQLTRGGAERQFALLAGELVKRGHDVCFVTLTDTGDSPEYLQLLGGSDRRILFKRRWPGPLRFVQFSRGWRPFRRLIREFNPDFVYSALEWTNWIAARAVSSIAQPPAFIAGIRTDSWELGAVPWRRRYPITCLAQHASRVPIDALIANSNRGLETAQELGFKATVNRVVWNGIDSETFTPDATSGVAFRQSCGIPDDSVLVGHVGRLDPQKDHPCLFQAFSLVLANRPSARLLCVGSGTDEYAMKLRALASELDVADAITWRSHVDDMPSVYSAMECYVQSSVAEGFPNVLAEAMSCGVPSVATRVGESELLLGDLGHTVPCGDPEALASGIEDALKKSRPSMESRDRIRSSFSVDSMVEQTVSVFDELLHGVHQ